MTRRRASPQGGSASRAARQPRRAAAAPAGRESAFARRVLALVQRIPAGRVVTYGDLAALAGRPGAARAVGTLMRTAARPGLPYHRVIAAGGRLGGYGGNEALKAALLRAEGVVVIERRVRGFSRVRWGGGDRLDGSAADAQAPLSRPDIMPASGTVSRRSTRRAGPRASDSRRQR